MGTNTSDNFPPVSVEKYLIAKIALSVNYILKLAPFLYCSCNFTYELQKDVNNLR